MKNSLIHIAIEPDTLANLINSGQINALDFKCLDFNSKLKVWKLFLCALKAATQPRNLPHA